ncbi:MAG: hypothetical protein JSR44_01860 [Spirochaetes bacterium]|nr:hypothetical protein [Spirochaetota bacterium]
MKRLALCLLAVGQLSAAAAKEVTLYLTSNLAGRFPLDKNLDDNAMLRVGAYLRQAKNKNPAAYHFDLGNAFYPGRLSRYSFGALTADYLKMIHADAGLVAAADLNIGADSLGYINRARGIRLLSANLFREKKPFFGEYEILKKGDAKVAVVGFTSPRSLVNFAEAQHLDLRLEKPDVVAPNTLQKIALENPDITIALTGLALDDALVLLAHNPQIDILLCGGDSPGTIGVEPVRAIELPDGRRAIAMPKDTPLVKLVLQKREKVWAVAERSIIDIWTSDAPKDVLPSFARRLTLWQKWFAVEEDADSKTTAFQPLQLTPQYAAASLRSSYGCDIAFLENDDIDTSANVSISRARDVRYAVQNDYDIFTFRMSGADARSFYAANPQLVFSGISQEAITGNPIRDNVDYRACATQRGYEIAAASLGKRAPAESQWSGISDSVVDAAAVGKNPDNVADKKFRLLTIFNLSNTYETGNVTTTANAAIPPGQPPNSYFKWGLENNVNFILYNRKHAFSFNPYIFYVRQNDQIINNLMRAQVTYTYNTEWLLKPYQRSRVDTVVVPINGLNPTFIRETAGAELNYGIFTGRFGLGFEKQVLDPATTSYAGFEATLGINWEFVPGITYSLAFDSFSATTLTGVWRNRIDMTNAVIFKIVDPLTFTVSHRYYYFYQESLQSLYNSSILLVSLDLRTTWKTP